MASKSSHQIAVEINGEPIALPAECTIREMLNQLSGVAADESSKKDQSTTGRHAAVAVELNLEIVPLNKFDSTRLGDGDVVEVVTLVGGG